jgi:ATP-dependent Clp protease ATP-binding subunit ClpA
MKIPGGSVVGKAIIQKRRRLESAEIDFEGRLSAILHGQPQAVRGISSFIEIHNAGLSPEGRPAGVFLLLGPTGTGKTRTVEAVAELLHGSAKTMIKVDCGEFQTEHEVARLIGAPPGYLGHRETPPVFTQARLSATTSPQCSLSIILFDEIEKAAPSVSRILLGICDRGILHLGDNTAVNFENTLIFLTSNLGARSMQRELRPAFGFSPPASGATPERTRKLEAIALNAVRRRFTPEFVNRIDSVITYQPLRREALSRILDNLIGEVQAHLNRRLGLRTFHLDIPPRTRAFLLDRGSSDEFGARELRRTLYRRVVQPMAGMVAAGRVRPGYSLRARIKDGAVVLESVTARLAQDQSRRLAS